MSSCENKRDDDCGNERSDKKVAGRRLTYLAMLIAILAATTRCPTPPSPPRPEPPAPTQPHSQDSFGSNEVAPSPSSDEPERAPQNPTDPIDLAPAIQETKEIFRRHGLPEDWYRSLVDSELASAVWTMVSSEVATQFQERFGTSRRPASWVYPSVGSDNIVFEEVLYRALQGDQHGDMHVHRRPVFSVDQRSLPNVNPMFVNEDGGIAFGKLREAFVATLQMGTSPFVVDEMETTASDSDEWCRVVSEWRSSDGLPSWAAKQIFWRPVIRVEFVEGERLQGDVINRGDRRLALSCYAQVGYRETENATPEPIFLAGPYVESIYQPVGKGYGTEEIRRTVPETSLCPKGQLVYGDLDSLNTEPTDYEKQQAAAADPRPSSEIPVQASGGKFGEPLREIHENLSSLIEKPQTTD